MCYDRKLPAWQIMDPAVCLTTSDPAHSGPRLLGTERVEHCGQCACLSFVIIIGEVAAKNLRTQLVGAEGVLQVSSSVGVHHQSAHRFGRTGSTIRVAIDWNPLQRFPGLHPWIFRTLRVSRTTWRRRNPRTPFRLLLILATPRTHSSWTKHSRSPWMPRRRDPGGMRPPSSPPGCHRRRDRASPPLPAAASSRTKMINCLTPMRVDTSWQSE